jgi:AraC-like DNA-binding protein
VTRKPTGSNHGEHASKLLGVAVRIDAEALRQVTGRMGHLTPAEAGSGVTVQEVQSPLLEAVVRLTRLLDSPEHAAGLSPVIQQEILYWLLVGPCGGRLLQIARHDSPSNRITQAMAWLRDRLASPLTVEDLAHQVGMSPSSFYSHFKAISRMTPIQYLKHLRLQEARRLMLVEDTDVGAAAFRVGYQSPSHFGKDYRRYFGVAPREDIQAIRRHQGVRPSLDVYVPMI